MKSLREEHRLRMFGLKRDEVTGDWRRLVRFAKYN
jgi:hypothetical protein